MILSLALLALQAASPATSSLVVESSVAVSSASPIRSMDGEVDGTVIVDVAGDPRRTYQIQVQTTVTEASGQTFVVSEAGGSVGPDGAARTDINGRDRLRISGATALLRLGIDGRLMLPLRIVYE